METEKKARKKKGVSSKDILLVVIYSIIRYICYILHVTYVQAAMSCYQCNTGDCNTGNKYIAVLSIRGRRRLAFEPRKHPFPEQRDSLAHTNLIGTLHKNVQLGITTGLHILPWWVIPPSGSD